MSHEMDQIAAHLGSGEWGEISDSIEDLLKQIELVKEAHSTFATLLYEVEAKRKIAFKKLFALKNTGICQAHHRYQGRDADPLLPFDQLHIVHAKEFWSDPAQDYIVCSACLGGFLSRLNPNRGRSVEETPAPEQLFEVLREQELVKIARRLKMPHLLYYGPENQ